MPMDLTHRWMIMSLGDESKKAFSFWLLAIGKKANSQKLTAKSQQPTAVLLKTQTSDNQQVEKL